MYSNAAVSPSCMHVFLRTGTTRTAVLAEEVLRVCVTKAPSL